MATHTHITRRSLIAGLVAAIPAVAIAAPVFAEGPAAEIVAEQLMHDFLAIRCTFWVNPKNGQLYLSEPIAEPHTEAEGAEFCWIKQVIRTDEKVRRAVMDNADGFYRRRISTST
jgi:hypothetical protein